MKFFPLKTVIICLVLTPILYIVTLDYTRSSLENRYLQSVQNSLIGNSQPLLNGTVHIEEQVAKNIQTFLNQDYLVQHKLLKLDILVTTSQGKIIYPTYVTPELLSDELGKDFNPEVIANQNFEILNSGLEVKVKIDLSHGSKIANALLILYSSISFFIFFIFYRAGTRKAEKNSRDQQELITNLKKEEKVHREIVNDISRERQGLFENIKALNEKYQADKEKAKINEDEMFKEIVSLEEKLTSSVELKKRKENEIEELKSAIERYERRKSSKGRRNEFDFLTKRFSALYKNVDMNRKALSGLLNLTEDQQIKAEEIILQLDREPEKVIIKRKVFSGKKHKTACLEVLFAYNGRLYFRNTGTRTEVVVIGTKNTQAKDMEFLHSL
ncbi:hypothetical protein [Desulfospira joergensenii]|uniref:hypothetical protein n=1 Tax=Desulfospira joergensenii TaxID=53329 RepID=UPI0003B5C41F|nr:hypothetical protein [Desulfospira joergensenii]